MVAGCGGKQGMKNDDLHSAGEYCLENAVQSDVVKHFSIVIGAKFLIVDRSEINNGPITTSHVEPPRYLNTSGLGESSFRGPR